MIEEARPGSVPSPSPVEEWYNVVPDLPVAVPPAVNSAGGHELSLLRRITPRGLLYLNTSKRRRHPIPDDVQDGYRDCGRPTPLMRAHRLEAYLETPARIYLKREDVVSTGSFKLNTALAQVSRARAEGYTGVVTETGAGQWGVSVSAACALYSMRCRLYMARCSFEQKPGRQRLMQMYGAEVFPSPSPTTAAGRALAADARFAPGSISTAISEAVEFARDHPGHAYLAGSTLPYVFIHHSVIGLETARQLRALGETPDVLVACVGGGSNFAGFALPQAYGPEAFRATPSMLACESTLIPRLTRGVYRYEHADPAGLTPLVKSYSLGADFVPPPTPIGGLRQSNGSALLGALYAAGSIRAEAYSEDQIFAAGRVVARLEGFLAAPESCHALCGVIAEAGRAAREQRDEVIVACVSGSGILDMDGFFPAAEGS